MDPRLPGRPDAVVARRARTVNWKIMVSADFLSMGGMTVVHVTSESAVIGAQSEGGRWQAPVLRCHSGG